MGRIHGNKNIYFIQKLSFIITIFMINFKLQTIIIIKRYIDAKYQM